MDSTIGDIRLFAFNFAPVGWAFCDGQLISIAENSALFSLLGTTYGGDGQSTFALPDLRGRIPQHQGQGPGLSSATIGEMAGTESVTVLTSQLPSHTHALQASAGPGTVNSPAGAILAALPDELEAPFTVASPDAAMASALPTAGGSQPVDIRPPTLTLNFCIALEGIYPSRN